MPRSKLSSNKKGSYGNEAGDESEPYSSESDFDEDDDPDKIEVPGGGKNLAAAANISTAHVNSDPVGMAQQVKIPNKIPGGLVTKGNTQPGYEMVRVPGSGIPYAVPGASLLAGNQNMMGPGVPMNYFPPGMSPMAASLLAQSKFKQNPQTQSIVPKNQMEMAGMGMGVNPYLLQNISSILGQSNLTLNQLSNLANMGGSYSNFATGMGAMANLGAQWMQGVPGKTLSHMWMNQNSKLNAVHEDEDADDEEMGVAETYAEYWPSKLKLGKKHPDAVVETASLSSVEPTDVWYKLSVPKETINGGLLSALQLESITYASQAHHHHLPDGSRAGFLIGDGAGVGKGRTIAGVIYENYLKGRKKAIWVSVSNDLKYDAERDLKDIGAGKIEVYPLNKFKYAKISSPVNGNVKKGVIFSTYSALIGESQNSGGKYKTRLKQLLQFCGEDFDGLIIFDECHKAKNLCPVGSSKPTKTGLTVLELQNKLPEARVVYASATGASEPRNMAYMVRLGMWGEGTPFPVFLDFISAVEKRGVGAMEIVAMDMKLRGMYIARQLSFHGVGFKIEEVPLTKDFTKTYDLSVKLWVSAMQKFTEAAELIDAENRMKKTMWGQFWSSHQRFFKYLCIAAKVNHAVAVAREAVKCGKCVVIGLQSTGEARTLEQLERDDGELSDFVSTAKGVLQSLVEKHFPAPDRNRIHRLLGIEAPSKKPSAPSHKIKEVLQEAGGSGGKRKPTRQASSRVAKKARRSSSESDFDSDNEKRRSSGSEYKISGSDTQSEHNSEDSNQSSDFNPFYSDSDSDADPWARKKKTKKAKKPTKKRPSTQDKIQELLTRKTENTVKPQTNGVGACGTYSYQPQAPPKDAIERACSMKEELLSAIETLGERLPANTLDQLIDELGGPENVAEMTGRKGRVVQTEDGQIQYESRSEVDVPLETLNLTEKQRFMDGEKDVAIISEAASSGISLQSDRRARNQRRRVHITLELPWSADRAIQQFGRTHRSNQVNAPEYIFLISDLAGERRFASTVAKRLESLGALTHGDRRATETRDLSQFNIDNKYGRSALEATMKTIMKYESPLVPPPQDYRGDFFKDVADALVGVGLIVNSEAMPGVLSLDKDYNNISKFLNRILGMPVELQNRLFKYFTDTLAAIITQAKKTGRFDLGILDLGTAGENVNRIKIIRYVRKHATGTAPTELHLVHVERGLSWQEAMERWAELEGAKEGFYISHQVRNGKQTAILAIAMDNGNKKKTETTKSKKDQLYQVFRPNTGLQFRNETLGELEKKYKKVSTDDAESHWTQQYDASVTTCSHAYWRGNCRNVSMGLDCEVGLRRRSYNVLSGSVLSVWTRVENVLATRSAQNNKMQVIRLKTTEGTKIVGTLIPKNCVEALREALASDAEKVEEETF